VIGRHEAPATPGARAAGGPRVVALGGGHGLAASLSALRGFVEDLTAVVTVADNGGSSGRLRREFACLPPGDLRMALAALCDDDDWGSTWAQVLQHRFRSEGDLDKHAVGNLLIVAIWELLGDHVDGLDLVGRLLQAQGRVLPMSLVPLDITAKVECHPGEAPIDVRGQVEVASARGRVLEIAIEPQAPPACPQALAAIGRSDWVVLGPGSWFTSVITHLLLPELRRALETTAARRLLVLNLAPQTGETEGFTPESHLAVLRHHAPDLRIDTVLVDPSALGDEASLRRLAGEMGAEVVVEDVACDDGSPRHDEEKLTRAYAKAMGAA
jgi:uncharacterized cofD-like protein